MPAPSPLCRSRFFLKIPDTIRLSVQLFFGYLGRSFNAGVYPDLKYRITRPTHGSPSRTHHFAIPMQAPRHIWFMDLARHPGPVQPAHE